MISLYNVIGIIWRWKNSIICLRLTFSEILHKNVWVSWEVLFKGLGVQKSTQMPCWLRPWLEVYMGMDQAVIIHSCTQQLFGRWEEHSETVAAMVDVDGKSGQHVIGKLFCALSVYLPRRPTWSMLELAAGMAIAGFSGWVRNASITRNVIIDLYCRLLE